MTLRDALLEASTHIARRDAELLLAHVLERDRTWLLAHADDDLLARQLEAFRVLTARRAAHEPLQYLTGVQEFYGLELQVTPAVLIPRPETEHLVEAVLEWAARRAGGLRVLDVGTGSGAIAIALARNLPQAQVMACDVSPAALEVARANAARLSARVEFVESDLLSALASRVDVVVSNPPYVPAGDAATMQVEVVEHEPHTALFAGEDGLAIYRRLAPQAHAALNRGGLLAMEFGFGQREALRTLLDEFSDDGKGDGWINVRFIDDYAGIPRVVLAERG